MDIPGEEVALSRLPEVPAGYSVSRVEVVIRLREDDKPAGRAANEIS
jgi:hypothetical protein